MKKAKLKLPKEIDHDTWAASGGTRGMFAAAVRSGKTKIVEEVK